MFINFVLSKLGFSILSSTQYAPKDGDLLFRSPHKMCLLSTDLDQPEGKLAKKVLLSSSSEIELPVYDAIPIHWDTKALEFVKSLEDCIFDVILVIRESSREIFITNHWEYDNIVLMYNFNQRDLQWTNTRNTSFPAANITNK